MLTSFIAKLWNIMLKNSSISFIANTLPGQLYLPCPNGRKSNLDKSLGFARAEAFAIAASRSRKRLGLKLLASSQSGGTVHVIDLGVNAVSVYDALGDGVSRSAGG